MWCDVMCVVYGNVMCVVICLAVRTARWRSFSAVANRGFLPHTSIEPTDTIQCMYVCAFSKHAQKASKYSSDHTRHLFLLNHFAGCMKNSQSWGQNRQNRWNSRPAIASGHPQGEPAIPHGKQLRRTSGAPTHDWDPYHIQTTHDNDYDAQHTWEPRS